MGWINFWQFLYSFTNPLPIHHTKEDRGSMGISFRFNFHIHHPLPRSFTKIHPSLWSLRSIYKKITHEQIKLDHSEFYFYEKYLRVKNKIVLDIGANNFDTAYFFLKNGAERVICVEKDFYKIPNDIKDKIQVYNEYFDPEKHLFLDYDVCKVDIEGYELLLLPYLDKLKKTIIEAHSIYIIDQFLKHDWKVYYKHNPYLVLMVNQ